MRLPIVLGIAALLGCGDKKTDAPAAGSAGVTRGANAAPAPRPSASGSAAGGGSAAAPAAGGACFPADGNRGFVSFTAGDKTATLCTDQLGSDDKQQLCLAVDFATGAWHRVAAAPTEPAPQPASGFEIKQDRRAVSVCKGTACKKLRVPPPRLVDGKLAVYLAAVSTDGKRAIVADNSLKGAWFFDATTGKKLRAQNLVADGGCMDNVAFLGEVVYIAVNVCAGPGAEGAFYDWAGKQLGKLEKVNPYGVSPIHLSGSEYAFADLNGSAIEVVDARTMKTRALDIPDIECEDCDVLGGAPVGGDVSLTRTASGQLVDLAGKAVIVVDPTATRIEKQYPFPLCPRPKQP